MKKLDLEDMVFWVNLTYKQIELFIDKIYIGVHLKSFSFSHGIYEVRSISTTLKTISQENKTIVSIAYDIKTKTVMPIDTNRNVLLKIDKFFFKQCYEIPELIKLKEVIPAINLILIVELIRVIQNVIFSTELL